MGEALAAAECAEGVFTRINDDVLDQAAHIDRARAEGIVLASVSSDTAGSCRVPTSAGVSIPLSKSGEDPSRAAKSSARW